MFVEFVEFLLSFIVSTTSEQHILKKIVFGNFIVHFTIVCACWVLCLSDVNFFFDTQCFDTHYTHLLPYTSHKIQV